MNGKRHGKGKEYENSGNLSFEGTYLNGKRHGKGKEYYFGRVIFDGEFSNGYIIEGIKYGRDGNLEFILERNGIGKEYYDGYLKFEGIYLRGEKMEKENLIEMAN